MSNIRGLSDIQGKKDEEKKTQSYTGGERSALAVENPNSGERSNTPFANVVRGSGPLPANHRKVTVYKNGFRIDDGEFRNSESPENKKFIENLKAGLAPHELQKGAQGNVHVALDDRSSENYEAPPPPKYTLFQGEGQSLSSSASAVASAAPVDASKGTVLVNEDAATTDLQFRFHNGTRTRQRFNESHTIADIHSYLTACAPVDGEYTIMTGFPPRELNIPLNTTLKDAGLLNETITQKLK